MVIFEVVEEEARWVGERIGDSEGEEERLGESEEEKRTISGSEKEGSSEEEGGI